MRSGRGLRVRGVAVRSIALLLPPLMLLQGCSGDKTQSDPTAASESLEDALADAFRIDISELSVTYDLWPGQDRARGTADLRFEMRPDQSRPVFHFNPIRHDRGSEENLLSAVTLDGKSLDPRDGDDVKRVRTSESAEPAFEIQRELDSGEAHTLQVRWSIPKGATPGPSGWFYTNFDDTEGPDDETETLWPTVSSPEEFARHHVRVRVHSDRAYTVVGSGAVQRRPGREVQEWHVDTVRPVASHTVFVAAVPKKRVRTRQVDVRGVNATIVSTRSAKKTKRAAKKTRRTIKRLVDDFGPFPTPTMQILLTGWGSGMEYYAATRTGIGSLEHELGHMYFGSATVNRTWRDTWIDEAAVVWWEEHDHHRLDLKSGFNSNIAGNRPPAEPGFNTRAYGPGAKVLAEIARALGGNKEMIDFLADLHQLRAFEPYTTDDFIDDVVAAQSEIDRDQLERWLLTPQ